MTPNQDQPRYQSGATLFRALAGIVALMMILSLALAWVDSKMLNVINDYKSSGLTNLPSNSANTQELLSFADEQAIECESIEDLVAETTACSTLVDIARTMNDYRLNRSLVWSFILLSNIALIITFALFIHRASSNLQHLRIAGQKYTPGWVVGWFFIPIMNLVKPTRIVRELAQASGSSDTKNRRAWQNARTSDGKIITSWWTFVIAAILFGPRGIGFFVGREDIGDWAEAGRLLVLSDLFQVLPLGLTVIVVYRLHRAQEIRHNLVLARRKRSENNS
jgi:hypothetical protein|tara:strand:+ start:356 stop:1192 length:837 start_codon:yes stop_codon:yes gene_type:complete